MSLINRNFSLKVTKLITDNSHTGSNLQNPEDCVILCQQSKENGGHITMISLYPMILRYPVTSHILSCGSFIPFNQEIVLDLKVQVMSHWRRFQQTEREKERDREIEWGREGGAEFFNLSNSYLQSTVCLLRSGSQTQQSML